MTANPDVIVAHAQEKFDRLIAFVRRADSSIGMLETEAAVLENVLGIGAPAMEALLSLESRKHAHRSARSVDGAELPYRSERSGQLQTIFGIVHFSRSYTTAKAKGAPTPN